MIDQKIVTSSDLPDWLKNRISLDRFSYKGFYEDDFIDDVRRVVDAFIPEGTLGFHQLCTTMSSIEMVTERRSMQRALLWDVDCLERLDGLLAFIFCDDFAEDDPESQRILLLALAHQTASTLYVRDPATAAYILDLVDNDELRPQTGEFKVEDDANLDRYRRLARVYIALHEIGHVLYSLELDLIEKIDRNIDWIVDGMKGSQLFIRDEDRSATNKELMAKGLIVSPEEIDEVISQIRSQTQTRRGREEVWCDMFACEALLRWAAQEGYRPEECFAVDHFLHLIFASRLQWHCYWDRHNRSCPWHETDLLKQQENRANVRGLFMAVMGYADHVGASRSEAPIDLSELAAYKASLSAATDERTKTYFDRANLALGVFEVWDRDALFADRDEQWAALADEDRQMAREYVFGLISGEL